ncbi:MAG TPA: GTPase domain-containing protein [Candidatus Limnocylindrales bacterium]
MNDRARQPAGSSAALRELVESLEGLAARRLGASPVSDASRGRATRFRDHLTGHVRVRAASLDAPLVVLLLGPTGAGKSTLFNTIAGRAASPTGVLRPTTRSAVVLAHRDDEGPLRIGALAGLDAVSIRVVADPAAEQGLALVDAPDVDSIEHANREIADRLVEAADLCIFVTTAARYADRVPWNVLARVRERGLPIVVVVNRLPPDAADRAEVLADVRRLFAEAGFGETGLSGESPLSGELQLSGESPLSSDAATSVELEIVGVAEGQLSPGGELLDRAAVAPILERIAHLRADRGARVALAARALAGSLAGLGPLVDQLADDVAHESIDAAALRRAAADNHERGLIALRGALARGTFLREEALRHWQTFVGADDVTRLFSKGIGAIRGMIASVFRPSTAPVAEVREATSDDIVALARQHAAEAARRTATAWSDEPMVARRVADDPTLWGTSAGFDDRLRQRIDDWIASIAADIAQTGEGKKRLAKGASIGVNAIGVGVMLATFIHTAGLTGTEVGIAAGTAFLNQKLLGALFGEAAMVELIQRARQRLDEALAAAFAEEQARFDRLVAEPEDLATLEADLRAAATRLKSLPVAVPESAGPVVPESATSTPAPAAPGS